MKQNNVNDLLLLLHAQFKTFLFAENNGLFEPMAMIYFTRGEGKKDTFHPKIYGSLIIIVIQ